MHLSLEQRKRVQQCPEASYCHQEQERRLVIREPTALPGCSFLARRATLAVARGLVEVPHCSVLESVCVCLSVCHSVCLWCDVWMCVLLLACTENLLVRDGRFLISRD